MPASQHSPYDLIAKQWDATRSGFRPGEETFLEAFVELLPSGGRVLDLGCGTGRPNGVYLTRAGLTWHGIDASGELLARARAHVPRGTCELADLKHYKIPAELDGVIAWDSLFHLERGEQSALFRRLAACLSPGAPFLFTSGGSPQEPFSDTMWNVEFHYDAHPPDQLPAELQGAGFEVIRSHLLEEPGGGRNKGRLAVLAIRLPVTAPAS